MFFLINSKQKGAAQRTLTNQSGVTLIEVMIYLGLFAILSGGAIAGAFNVVESSGRNATKAMVQEEGDFLLAKINWALSGASAINQPAIGDTGSLLSVNKVIGLDSNNQPISIPITISLSGGDIQINYPNNPGPNTFLLNNSNVSISGLSYVHLAGSGNGINSESIRVNFTVNTKTPSGADISESFYSTNYLRK